MSALLTHLVVLTAAMYNKKSAETPWPAGAVGRNDDPSLT